jgi:hypothetical protein
MGSSKRGLTYAIAGILAVGAGTLIVAPAIYAQGPGTQSGPGSGPGQRMRGPRPAGPAGPAGPAVTAAAPAATPQQPFVAPPTTSSTQPFITPTAAQPVSLLQQPAQSAKIVFTQNSLVIHAENSSLAEILHQFAEKSGMQISGLGNDERVFGNFGPGAPRDVLADLLNGTAYNQVLLGDLSNGAPRELILTPTTHGDVSSGVPSQQAAAAADEPEPEAAEVPQPPPQPELSPAPVSAAAPQQVKTPQQLFEQLQQMRQQQQQQQQQ